MEQKLNEYMSIEDGVVFGTHEKSFVGFPADRPMLMLCDGAAGCGKSSQFVRPIVFGSIARGETVVVSGLLCEADYLKRAAAEGYRVVVIYGNAGYGTHLSRGFLPHRGVLVDQIREQNHGLDD